MRLTTPALATQACEKMSSSMREWERQPGYEAFRHDPFAIATAFGRLSQVKIKITKMMKFRMKSKC